MKTGLFLKLLFMLVNKKNGGIIGVGDTSFLASGKNAHIPGDDVFSCHIQRKVIFNPWPKTKKKAQFKKMKTIHLIVVEISCPQGVGFCIL